MPNEKGSRYLIPELGLISQDLTCETGPRRFFHEIGPWWPFMIVILDV
jgi:hypothetical protein